MRRRLLGEAWVPLLLALSGCAESPAGGELERDATIEPVTMDSGAAVISDAGPDIDAATPEQRDAEGEGGALADAGGNEVDAASLLDASPPVEAGSEQPEQSRDGGNDSGPPPCALTCGGSCVDPRTHPAHCGGCGTTCGATETCSQSKCALAPSVRGCSVKRFNNRDYLLCTEEKSWRDARKVCLDARMDLAVVDSRAENDFLRMQADSWIAPNDITREGEWRVPELGATNLAGAALGYTRWASLEPNNFVRCDGINIVVGCLGGEVIDEDCALLRGDGSWIDLECGLTYKFACEAF